MPTEAVLAYPDPRLQRSPRSPSSSYLSHVAGLTPPRSRVFSVDMGAVGNARSTVSFGVINGPAMFRRFLVQPRQVVDPTNVGFEIGYSQVSVTESSAAIGSTKPYTQLMERIFHPYFSINQNIQGYTHGTFQVANMSGAAEPRLIVSLATFYFTFSVISTMLPNMPSSWIMAEIIENLHPDALKYLT